MAAQPSAALLPASLRAEETGAAPDTEEADGKDPILQRLEQSTLPDQPGYPVDKIEFDLPGGRLVLEQGTLFRDRVDGTRSHELVFIGNGSLRVDAANEIERYQLRLHGGEDRLERRFNRAVLLFGGDQADDLLLGRAAAAAEQPGLATARSMYEAWVERGPRNSIATGVRPLLAALHDDAIARDYMAVWVHDGDADRDFYFRNDPWELETVEAGELFVPDKPKEGEIHPDRLDDDRFCNWMIWTRYGGGADRTEPGLRPKNHRLDLKLRGEKLEAEGSAEIEARANADGMRVVTATMASTMEITEARDGAGRELPTYSTGPYHFLVLPDPTIQDENWEFDLRFSGEPVRRRGGRQRQRSPSGWYPRLTGLYRSSFKARLEWPKEQTLLGAGTLVESGETEATLWEERVTETPMQWFSFEIGDFDVVHDEAGHIKIRLGVERTRHPLTDQERNEILAGLKGSILFYESIFGWLPINEITVAVVDGNFSQGLLSFITLARVAMTPTGERGLLAWDTRPDAEIRYETVAHEMAHQWWGNIVGWASYRDQWLSEALADYCAVQFMLKITRDRSDYLTARAGTWKGKLTRASNIGRPVYTLGPVTLGTRLAHNHGSDPYSALIYDKGSVVFTTLARQLGRDATWSMLGDLYEAVNNRLISTENFLGAFAHMSGADLDAFAERYIYGVDIPRIYYRYESAQQDGVWTIQGETEHLIGLQQNVRLVQQDRRWAVEHVAGESGDLSDLRLAIPFRVRLIDGNYQSGTVLVEGEQGRFSLQVAGEPVEFEFDPLDEVLANTVCLSCGEGRRHLQYARDLFAQGRFDAVPGAITEGAEAYAAAGDRTGELRAHVARARFRLDRGDIAGAMEQLKSLRKELEDAGFEQQRFEWLALEARIDLLRGARGSAMSRLTELSREVGNDGYFTSGDGEILAVLAAAAHDADRPELAADAARIATYFGADVAALGY
ncbi:hypothetical protein ABI59_10620 [Acidobacteria bacterium Mor1]|nr:hypothetical protein ABI59_10620 [Acidobacteria bacterium Mor1]